MQGLHQGGGGQGQGGGGQGAAALGPVPGLGQGWRLGYKDSMELWPTEGLQSNQQDHFKQGCKCKWFRHFVVCFFDPCPLHMQKSRV